MIYVRQMALFDARAQAYAERRYGRAGLSRLLLVATTFTVLGALFMLVRLVDGKAVLWSLPLVGVVVLLVLESYGVLYRRRYRRSV